ncbi:heme-binding domain-containing protein [Anaerolineales bacterium HSG6]|nr:heme-binding domain-containing protein [Anaerolineales bacterium HSG6]MDM8532031.1 heme-binding domain-containing protein [Anaerolineales bacterium HSG25]
MIKKIVISILILVAVVFVALICIQFVPVDRSNPPVLSEPNWDSPQTRELMVRACFDCHSNETKWPWYSAIAPVSWLIADHVLEGREEFNVSEWPSGDGDEAAEEVEEDKMPLKGYLLLHPEASFTAEETGALIKGLKATFGEEHEHDDDDD